MLLKNWWQRQGMIRLRMRRRVGTCLEMLTLAVIVELGCMRLRLGCCLLHLMLHHVTAVIAETTDSCFIVCWCVALLLMLF